MTTKEVSSEVIENLTAAEMSIAERTSKLSVATLEDPNFPKVDLLGALAWVNAKRTDPTLKFKDYMESHTLEQITNELGIEDDEEEEDEKENDSESDEEE